MTDRQLEQLVRRIGWVRDPEDLRPFLERLRRWPAECIVEFDQLEQAEQRTVAALIVYCDAAPVPEIEPAQPEDRHPHDWRTWAPAPMPDDFRALAARLAGGS